MRNIKKIVFIGLAFFILSASCKKKEVVEPEITFEKKDIMTQLADNYIVPSISKVQTDVNSLSTSWQSFLFEPTQENFDATKESWKAAYKSFQYVKMFDFGPFMEVGYANALGVFPSDTNQIENNISAGTYDLATVSNISAIGFSALDFLLFQENAMTLLNNSTNRKAYVSALISKMKTETDYVATNWSSYSSTFKDGTGTSSTSPFSMLVNAFCKDYEITKNAKIGIPLGKQSLGIQRLDYLEAPKSGIGTELIVENLKGLRKIFSGNSLAGASGTGFDDYLIALEKQSLASTIESRFDYLITEPSSWTANLKNMMINSTATIDSYYTYFHGTVVFIKTDMSSAFGILITYQDNDGD